MSQIRVNIHDVMHDEQQFNVNQLEERMEKNAHSYDVESVEIKKGNKNSPVFFEFEPYMNNVNFNTIRRAAKEVLYPMELKLDGVDREHAVRDNNLMIINS